MLEQCDNPACPVHGTGPRAIVIIGNTPPPKCTNSTQVPFSQDQPKPDNLQSDRQWLVL